MQPVIENFQKHVHGTFAQYKSSIDGSVVDLSYRHMGGKEYGVSYPFFTERYNVFCKENEDFCPLKTQEFKIMLNKFLGMFEH